MQPFGYILTSNLSLSLSLIQLCLAIAIRAQPLDLLIKGGHVIDPKNGHLDVGAIADLAVFRLRRGDFRFVDTGGNRMPGDQKLEAELTFREGRVVRDLNGIFRPR